MYGQNNDKLDLAVKSINEKIDYKEIQEIFDEKLDDGTFFDYKFLKISAEMIFVRRRR